MPICFTNAGGQDEGDCLQAPLQVQVAEHDICTQYKVTTTVILKGYNDLLEEHQSPILFALYRF